MLNLNKKTLYTITGLAIIATSLFFGYPSSVKAVAKRGQIFGDWAIAHSIDEKQQPVYSLTQQLTTTRDGKDEIIVIYRIGYFGKDQKLSMIQSLPLDISILPGTAIISAKKLIAPGKYFSCNSEICSAFAEISADELQIMLANDDNSLVFVNLAGAQVVLPISNKGLKDGLKALK